MCYSKGALGRFNPLERLVGEKAYKVMDPGMAATERATDRALTSAFGTQPDKPNFVEVGSAPLQDIPMARRRPQQTLLTGSSLSAPGTSAAPGISLLGG